MKNVRNLLRKSIVLSFLGGTLIACETFPKGELCEIHIVMDDQVMVSCDAACDDSVTGETYMLMCSDLHGYYATNSDRYWDGQEWVERNCSVRE